MGASLFRATTTVTSAGGICGPPAPACGASPLPQAERIKAPGTAAARRRRRRTTFDIMLRSKKKNGRLASGGAPIAADRFRYSLTEMGLGGPVRVSTGEQNARGSGYCNRTRARWQRSKPRDLHHLLPA